MRFRTTLLLLLVVLGLGAYLYYVEMPSAEQEAKAKRLYDVKADDISELTLTYQDHEIALMKTGEEWHMSKPLDVLADATAVKNIAATLADAESKKELTESSGDLSVYGLDKPFVVVHAKAKDKDLPVFSVGKTTPIGSNAYVQRADDKKIFLTNSAFRTGLDKQPKDLRDKTILNFADGDVQRIELHAADKDIRLGLKNGAWVIEQPGSFIADATIVRTLLSSLRSLRANDFPDAAPEQLAAYGLTNPRLKVSLFLGKDNARKDILLGGDNGDKKEVYLQTSGNPTVYTVSDWVMRDLNKDAGELRDKTVLAFDRAALTAIEVRRADGDQFKLIGSDKDGWKVDGNPGNVATSAMSQWLGDLHDLKGFEIAADNPTNLASFGLDAPLMTITFKGAQDVALGSILIGEHKAEQGNKEFFAMPPAGPTVFKIRDYLVTRLNKRGQDFIEVATPTRGTGTPPPMAGEGGPEDEGDEDGGQ